jgi:hypothetical protein
MTKFRSFSQSLEEGVMSAHRSFLSAFTKTTLKGAKGFDTANLSSESKRLLKVLMRIHDSEYNMQSHAGQPMGLRGRIDSENKSRIRLSHPQKGVSLSAGVFAQDTLTMLEREALIDIFPSQGGVRICLTLTGVAHAKRHLGHYGTQAFLAQHTRLEHTQILHEGAMTPVQINAHESPLAWLYRRKDASGRSHISTTQFMAGERLRHDMHIANFIAPMGIDLTRVRVQTSQGAQGHLNVSESVLAARQRMSQALRAVNAPCSDLLIDVCGFLKSLQLIERERGWPIRTAKYHVQEALSKLASHYGMSEEARGKLTSR